MNRTLKLPADVRALYPWEGRYLDLDAGRLHYLDVGPKDAPVLLCLHGNPTWSFYWREVVRAFSDRFRVIVPDHLGCGLSDKPQGWPYRLEGHVANVEALIDHLGIPSLTFVLHDWGGAIGMGVATRRPEIAERFVVTNTAAFLSKAIPPSIAMVKIPGLGAMSVRGFNGFARVALVRAASTRLKPAVKRGLLFPYGSWEDRIAHLRFVEDIPLSPGHPSWGTLASIDAGLSALADKPMLILWGDDDFCFTPAFRAIWQQRFPRATVRAWEGVGHYVMEDAPDRVIAELNAFLPAGIQA